MLFVQYVGGAMQRVVAKEELGVEVAEDDGAVNFVWEALNGFTQEMSAEAYELLTAKTSRSEWIEVPDWQAPPISGEEIDSQNDQLVIGDAGLEGVGSVET